MKTIRWVLLLPGLWISLSATASPIFFEAVDLADTTAGVDLWRYDYMIGNDTALDLFAFTIYFDFDLYDFNLVESPAGSGDFIVEPSDFTAPSPWDALVAPNVDILGVEEDGFFDVFNAFDVISPGASLLGGFSVTFAFNGVGAPGSQFFEFFGLDAAGNEVIGSSFTQLMAGPQPVPEPGTLLLMCAGLLALARQRAITASQAS